MQRRVCKGVFDKLIFWQQWGHNDTVGYRQQVWNRLSKIKVIRRGSVHDR